MGILCGLSAYIWQTGGVAFSPGTLSSKGQPGIVLDEFSSHAEFEEECRRCHAPMKTTQDQLCLVCHQRVADQISLQSGTHAEIDHVSRCAECHADHRGRDYDPTQLALAQFDHTQTKFSLLRHYVDNTAAPMDCSTCHILEPEFRIDVLGCVRCHGKEDAVFMVNHIQDFGESCVTCHDGLDSMVNFDHQTTAFPLEGLHQELACLDCHRVGKPDSEQPRQSLSSTNRLTARPSNPVLPQDNPFANTPNTCAACHSEPPIHLGTFTSECQTCHTPAGWTPALLDGKHFDHTASSGFSLARHQRDSDNRPFACSNCHQQNISIFDQRTCLDCHSQGESGATFMIEHVDQFGSLCQGCHDGIDRMHRFDHSWVFPLEGRHTDIECTACHVNKVFSGTPTECIECHTESVLHAGLFGLHCQYCHTPQNWAPAYLRIHNFPLEHGNKGKSECQVCHLEKYIEYSCYGCHDHQPGPIEASHQKAGISPQDLPNCTTCHPAGSKDGM